MKNIPRTGNRYRPKAAIKGMVEEAILAHPDVATAAVVGASDERQGQEI